MSVDQRLKVIARRLPPPRPPKPRFDYRRLSVAELEELEALAVKVGQKSNGRADFSAISDAELDRLAELSEKPQVTDAA